jgi:phage-related protein
MSDQPTKLQAAFFCIADGRMILLHSFIKKTQTMPKADFDLARDRQNEVNR